VVRDTPDPDTDPAGYLVKFSDPARIRIQPDPVSGPGAKPDPLAPILPVCNFALTLLFVYRPISLHVYSNTIQM
jgi:hypothetical protein